MERVDLRDEMVNIEAYRDWQRPVAVDGVLIHHSAARALDGEGVARIDPHALARDHVDREGAAHVAYHYLVTRDGGVLYLLDEEIAGYHAAIPAPPEGSAGHRRWQATWENGQHFNRRTIGVLVAGWFDEERGGRPASFSSAPGRAQWFALLDLLQDLRRRYALPVDRIEGHREALARTGLATTACPGDRFDLERLREALRVLDGVPGALHPPPPDPVTVPGPAPPLSPGPQRPLVGLVGRPGPLFTGTDWEILEAVRVESLALTAASSDAVFVEARQRHPAIDFVVRLTLPPLGRAGIPTPAGFAGPLRDRIDDLEQRFGVRQFEILNEPNHPTGREGWGASAGEARRFTPWYLALLTLLRRNHPRALFGFPALSIPHNDLEWLEVAHEAVEASDWLGCHAFWQSPPAMQHDRRFGRVYELYHERFPDHPIVVTAYANTNGHDPNRSLTPAARAAQYREWHSRLMTVPYVLAAHGYLTTSPDPNVVAGGFPWGDASGPFPVAAAIGTLPREAVAPRWGFRAAARPPAEIQPGATLRLPLRLENSGRTPLRHDGSTGVLVEAAWHDAAGQVVGPTRLLPLPRPLPQGGQVRMLLEITAPRQSGQVRLVLSLFHRGYQTWLHEVEGWEAAEVGWPLTVLPAHPLEPRPLLAASYRVAERSIRGIAGQTEQIEVEVTNRGGRRWESRGAAPGSVRLGHRWTALAETPPIAREGAQRGLLSAPVEPDETVRVRTEITFPSRPGAYRLLLALVSEQEQWFPDQLSLAVHVVPPHRAVAYSIAPAERLEAGGQGLFAVTLTNNGSAPLAGAQAALLQWWAGPDSDGTAPATPARFMLGRDLPPGETLVMKIGVAAPATPGTWRFRLDVADRDGRRLSRDGSPVPDIPLLVEGRVQPWAAAWQAVEIAGPLVAGRFGQVDIVLRNIGSRHWARGAMRVALGVGDSPVRRVTLPTAVAPGQTIRIGLPLFTPEAGRWELALDLWDVNEGLLGIGPPPRTIDVMPAAGRSSS